MEKSNRFSKSVKDKTIILCLFSTFQAAALRKLVEIFLISEFQANANYDKEKQNNDKRDLG